MNKLTLVAFSCETFLESSEIDLEIEYFWKKVDENVHELCVIWFCF